MMSQPEAYGKEYIALLWNLRIIEIYSIKFRFISEEVTIYQKA